MADILYLASKSSSRKALLEKAGISCQMIQQTADESYCNFNASLQEVVVSIALQKMQHVIMPKGKQGEIAFVLTADTMSQDSSGNINGKPVDLADGIAMLQRANKGPNHCGTAFCLEKKIFDGAWRTEKQIIDYAQAMYEFIVPDEWMVSYLEQSGALQAAGAIKIEDGPQFLKWVNGSYSTIMGLPMFEVWQGLQKLGFF